MQIPLLLVLAANDDLMAPSEDTHGIVFRMIPNNGRQAVDMADSLRGQIQPHQRLRIALFHEPNSFGDFLNRQLSHELQWELINKKLLLDKFEVLKDLNLQT